MRFMIVDNRTSMRKLVRKLPELPGMTVCERASGDEAVLRMREFKPDCVTMDARMPGRNGFPSAENLRPVPPVFCEENFAALRMRLIKKMCDLNEMPPGSESRMPDTP